MQLLPLQLLVLAKEPVAGRAKTRLSPPLRPAQAAAVARACLADTLIAVAGVPARSRTVVLDGAPGSWLPSSVTVLPQRAGDLGSRLRGAFQDCFADSGLPMLLVGMDTPQVTAALLTDAAVALLTPGTDAVLGDAHDGGWWALGLRRPAASLFDGVPMSTGRTGQAQRHALDALGLATTALPALRDIDHVDDIGPVAALQAPDAYLATLVRTQLPELV